MKAIKYLTLAMLLTGSATVFSAEGDAASIEKMLGDMEAHWQQVISERDEYSSLVIDLSLGVYPCPLVCGVGGVTSIIIKISVACDLMPYPYLTTEFNIRRHCRRDARSYHCNCQNQSKKLLHSFLPPDCLFN